MLVGQHAIIDLNFSHLEGASVFTKQFKDIIEGILSWASVVAQTVKNPPAMQETWVSSLGWEDPLEKGMVTHSSILPGEFHRQRSPVGYRPWCHKESDITERLPLHQYTK